MGWYEPFPKQGAGNKIFLFPLFCPNLLSPSSLREDSPLPLPRKGKGERGAETPGISRD
jgi:hypothetical protein